MKVERRSSDVRTNLECRDELGKCNKQKIQIEKEFELLV